ncbi:MAG: fumarylacetoacetase [Burkholderiales bacterium]
MTEPLNETHDPLLRGWLASANDPAGDFPIQNLPFGVFRRKASGEAFRGGVAIGDQVLDLAAAHAAGAFDGLAAKTATTCCEPALNDFMAMGAPAWSALRLSLSRALRAGSALEPKLRACLVPQDECEHAPPAVIGDYTDFYASIHHAAAVGALFRPDQPLLPNYKWLPIAYHGRSSSIGASSQQFRRPRGQVKPPQAAAPSFAPSARLDYELELGVFIGPGNTQGMPIDLAEAEGHVFGLVLLNDWSARDIQAWEYQPLGPFLAKNFATTISPWVVTLEALAPFRTAWTRPAGDPQLLAHLDPGEARTRAAVDIRLETWLETGKMRAAGAAPALLAKTSFRHAYWTIGQLVTHHASNGCNLRPGDLLGTGTQSGPVPEEAGSLLELTGGGKKAIRVPNGETRTFLEDGDAVILRAYCEREGFVRIGFGQCVGRVLPALS